MSTKIEKLTAPARLALRIGRGRTLLEVADYAEASRIYCELRDRSGLGASRMPAGWIYDAETSALLATLSYNGKAWDAADRCVFNPYEGGGMFP